MHVEQVGWGVARQVARVLRDAGTDDAAGILDRLPEVAETPGFLAYAVFAGRTATAAAIVSLPGPGGHAATYVGDALAPGAEPGTHEALVERAKHDVANAGVEWPI